MSTIYKHLSNATYKPTQLETWAMALSAPYYSDIKTSMKCVTGISFFSGEKQRIYKELIEKYGCAGPRVIKKDRETTLHDVSTDILHYPGQAYYQFMRMRIILLGDGADAWIDSLPDDRKKRQAAFVQKNLYLLPIAGIQAWNISQAIYYDRCSLLLGLEGAHTVIAKITRHAQLAQILYGGWEEYFTAYATGVQFMHPEVRLPNGLIARLEDIIGYIYAENTNLPWNLKLN